MSILHYDQDDDQILGQSEGVDNGEEDEEEQAALLFSSEAQQKEFLHRGAIGWAHLLGDRNQLQRVSECSVRR